MCIKFTPEERNAAYDALIAVNPQCCINMNNISYLNSFLFSLVCKVSATDVGMYLYCLSQYFLLMSIICLNL